VTDLTRSLKEEWNERLARGYTDEQMALWLSGVCTAWRLLRGHPPPWIPGTPELSYKPTPGRTPCSNHKGFKEDCGCA